MQPTITTAAGAYTVAYGGSGLTLTASDMPTQTLVNSYVLSNYNSVNWTVSRAQVVVSAPTVTASTYGAGTAATLSTSGVLSAGTGNAIASTTGILAGDAANVTLVQAATGTFASRNAGSGIVVSYTDSLSGSAAANYQLVEPAITGTINQAPLIVTGTVVAPKTYDGTTTVGISGGTRGKGTGSPISTTSGVLASDITNVHLTAATTGTFNCANVSGCTTVTVTDALTGSAATNYILTQPALTGAIRAGAAHHQRPDRRGQDLRRHRRRHPQRHRCAGGLHRQRHQRRHLLRRRPCNWPAATPTGTFTSVDAGTHTQASPWPTP